MNKLYQSLFLASSIFATCSAKAASNNFFNINQSIPASTQSQINNAVGERVNYNALNTAINDAKLINNSTIQTNLSSNSPVINTISFGGSSFSFSSPGTQYYNSSSISGTINGHAVSLQTTNGTALGQLKLSDLLTGGKINKKSTQVNLSSPTILTVDGQQIINGSTVNRADLIDLARTLGILQSFEVATSTSLASTSPSSASSQLVYSQLLDPLTASHKQRQAQQKLRQGSFNIAMADLKYEQAKFTQNDDRGDIKGTMISFSTDVMGVEIGGFIPYDYMSFDTFHAHRTGTVLYAKRNWQLPQSLQLTTLVNFNYIATYVSSFSVTNTFGGGFGTSLSYDNGGDFIPKVSFALQYNEDDYYKANNLIKDNGQLLIKTGASLGYRLFESGALQLGFIYNRDITDYQSFYNKNKDNDYFDITFGGSYSISDMWKIDMNYKRILGLDSYYSNAFFLGTKYEF